MSQRGGAGRARRRTRRGALAKSLGRRAQAWAQDLALVFVGRDRASVAARSRPRPLPRRARPRDARPSAVALARLARPRGRAHASAARARRARPRPRRGLDRAAGARGSPPAARARRRRHPARAALRRGDGSPAAHPRRRVLRELRALDLALRYQRALASEPIRAALDLSRGDLRCLLAAPSCPGAAALPASPASAEILGVGGDPTVNLQADQLDIDILAGEATLTGKVTLSKGDLVVNCPRDRPAVRPRAAPHVGARARAA